MLSKSAVFVALFAASANLVLATPPPCLLAAVNTFPNPSDLKTICGSGASKMKSEIQSVCGSNAAAATTAYASICKSAGFTVAAPSPSHSKSSTSSTKSKTKSSKTTMSKTTGHATMKHATTTSKSSSKHDTTAKQTTVHKHVVGATKKTTATGHANKATGIVNGGSSGTAPPPGPVPTGQQSSTATASSMPTTNAGGKVDAEGFAALALAAAGLVIFL